MTALTLLGPLLGGIGLFLLGMWLMTDGLKLAAGPALQRVLARSTETPLRGFASGVVLTALVQSSSAVTVAAIGFINAGLVSLYGVLWVLFGANVGTTMTGWLVALIGLEFKIQLLALPMIGAGMMIRIFDPEGRRGALGLTLAGFGTLFLGLDLLREGFSDAGTQFTLPTALDGVLSLLAHLAIGIVLTVVMQSSSAALAIALTAAQGGLLPITAAAAVVIGANVGTTATALLATLGATPNAKRAAAGHVAFNVLTAAVALAILPVLLGAIRGGAELAGIATTPAVVLALFHTVFNLLGVLLMLPVARRLSSQLERRFTTQEEDEARPRHLDESVLAVPELALEALRCELQRVAALSVDLARRATAGAVPGVELARSRRTIESLNRAIAGFIAKLNRASMAPEAARRLPLLLRAARYFETVAELGGELSLLGGLRKRAALPAPDEFESTAVALLERAHPDAGPDPALADPSVLEALSQSYERAKVALLEAGAGGDIDVAEMDLRLDAESLRRRLLEQAIKGARLLLQLQVTGAPANSTDGTIDAPA
jgi:phosphate:Na+ symporter